MFFQCFDKIEAKFIHVFFDFHEKAWIFGLKMTIFQILIKWPEMIVSGCYIAQNDRNEQIRTELNVRSQYYMRNISNLPKKSSGYKNEQNIFYSFGFVLLVRQLKIVSLSKLSHKIFQDQSFLLRVSTLSYLK